MSSATCTEEELDQKYIESPNTCPFCGSENLDKDVSQFDIDLGALAGQVRCETCGSIWDEVFNLVGITNVKHDINSNDPDLRMLIARAEGGDKMIPEPKFVFKRRSYGKLIYTCVYLQKPDGTLIPTGDPFPREHISAETKRKLIEEYWAPLFAEEATK